jgi:predicted nucleotidyltransferase
MCETPLTREQGIDWLSEPEIRALRVQRLPLVVSVSRVQARHDSSVDLLVQFFPGSQGRFLALPELLERRLAAASEFVTIAALSPFLRLASWRKRKMYFECVITFATFWVETEHPID